MSDNFKNSQKYIIRENNFIGYNDRLPPEQLKKGYLSDCLNALCKTGSLKKRPGFSLIGSDVGSSPCQGLKGVEFSNGTKELLLVFNGIVYKWTGSGGLSSIGGSYTLDTSANVEIVMANNNVYFFDGTNTVPKYNGSTMSTVAAIPKGKYAKWFHNQLHVAEATRNTLDSSNLGNPEDYSSGSYSTLGINPNDGDLITGLQTLKDELLISKRNRVWAATGFGTSALTIDDIGERITGGGTLSHRSMLNTGNEVVYISFHGGTPHFRSIARSQYGTIVDNGIVSTDIENTMMGLNKARLNQVSGVFDGRICWYSLPNGSSTTNNLVLTFDTITRGWQRHTGINASVLDSFSISGTPQIYFGEATSDSKAYVFDTSTSDNGTAITYQVISRRYGGDSPESKKKWKRLYTRAEESGNYDITITKSVDGFDYETLGTLNLAGSGSVLDSLVLDTSRLGTTDVKRDAFNISKSRNYYIQYKFLNTSASSSINIRDWEMIYYKKSPTNE